MGFSYHELKRIKKNSIVLEKKENIEIQQNCTGFSRKKSTFIRERFFCAPTNSCRHKCNEHKKDKRIKEKLSKQSVDVKQNQLKDTLVLEENLQEQLEEKVQNTCYQLANLEEDINHEIEKLQVGNNFLLETFSGMEKHFCEKTQNNKNKEEKTWAEQLAHNSCGCGCVCKDKQQDHSDIAKERFSLQHQCISTSPRYGDDEHLAPRPRMRSVGSQITTAIESLDQGALGDHKNFSNFNLKKENKLKDYKEHLTKGIEKYPQIREQNSFTVNCCSGMSQPPYCSYDVYSKVPPNGVGNYHYNCYQPDNVEGTPPNVYCRTEYYYDCTKCGSNSHNKRTCNSPSIKIPIRRQNTDLNTEYFCTHTADGSELKTTKDISPRNKNASKEKQFNERKSRVQEKTKEHTAKRNRSNSKTKSDNKTAKEEKLKKEIKILKNLDRYVDERDKELKLKRKQIASEYSSTPTTTTKVRSEAKLFQVLLCKKLSNADTELLLGSYDSLSLGSQYSAKTLQVLKQMKISKYKPAKPHDRIMEDDTDEETRRQEKLRKYQQYCEKYKKECQAKETIKVLKEPETNFGERASHEMDLFKQQKDTLKDSSEGLEDFQQELQTIKEVDYGSRRHNQDNPKSSQKNYGKEKTNSNKVQGETKTVRESPSYEKFGYEHDQAKRGLNGWKDYDRYRHPYNNEKYNRDFHEDRRDKARNQGSFDYTDGDSMNVETTDRFRNYNRENYNRNLREDVKNKISDPDSSNKVKDSLKQAQQTKKPQTAKNNAKDRDFDTRKENGQRRPKGIDENSHRAKQRQYEYDQEANYYSPVEDSQLEVQRDANVRKRELKEQENKKKNVDEFERRAQQRPYKYDKEGNYFTPNEDSQFQMQRDANARKRELKEQEKRKGLEENGKNLEESQQAIDENGHRTKQRSYKYDKEANYYTPNEDSQFQMQRDANVRKREFEEQQIRKDLENNKIKPVSNLTEETLHSPEWSRQQKHSPNEFLTLNEESKGDKPTRHISRKQTQDVNERNREDIQIKRLTTNTPKIEKEHKFRYEQDQKATQNVSPPHSPILKKDNKNDESVPSSYKDFRKAMDHNLGIYTNRSSQTESNSPTEPNDRYSTRTFSLEQDSVQNSLTPATTEDALKYLNNFLQIYQQQTGLQQKCLSSVTTAAYNLITKLSSCKNISSINGNSEILRSPKNPKESNKSLEDKATSTVLEQKLTQDVVYKDPKSTPDASAAQFKQKFQEPLESGKNVFKAATNENDENFLSAKSNDQELEYPNVMEELIPQSFETNLATNERFEGETYQSPDNLEFWDTVENYQRYQECKDDSLNSFTQQPQEFPSEQFPTYDTTYEPEYYETYAESPYRDLPTSSRQPIFDPDIMPAKGILKPYRVAENPHEEFCDFETYTSASMVSTDQKDHINVKQGFSVTCSKGQDSQEQLPNDEMEEVFIAKEKYLNPIEEESYLEVEKNTKYNQPDYHDCQLDIKSELDNDPSIGPPPFKQCPCMWETYVKMMQNY